MSSYRTIVRRLDNGNINFYLLVISNISTRTRTLYCTTSSRTRKSNEIRDYTDLTCLVRVELVTVN